MCPPTACISTLTGRWTLARIHFHFAPHLPISLSEMNHNSLLYNILNRFFPPRPPDSFSGGRDPLHFLFPTRSAGRRSRRLSSSSRPASCPRPARGVSALTAARRASHYHGLHPALQLLCLPARLPKGPRTPTAAGFPTAAGQWHRTGPTRGILAPPIPSWSSSRSGRPRVPPTWGSRHGCRRPCRTKSTLPP